MNKHKLLLARRAICTIVSAYVAASFVNVAAAQGTSSLQQTQQQQAAAAAAAGTDNGLPNLQGSQRTDTRQGSQRTDTRQGAQRTDMRQGAQRQDLRSQQYQDRRNMLPIDPDKDVFSLYANKVTGKELPVFGRELFNDVPDTFAATEAAQVNPDYVIGAGDELQIRGWGMIDIDVTAMVDRSGAIYIPRVGSVKVAGVKYSDLQGYLKKAIGKNFSGFDITAGISQTRAVQIYVVGHALRPGTYTLSSMSTLLNALFSSGGPSATGSMRAIEVKRGGRTVTTFDLYDMIVKGDKTRDISLQDGDIIRIPQAGPMVALTGNVKTPAIYELRGNESVADLVTWAGGFDSAAEGKRVVVEKNVDNTFKTVSEITAVNGAVAPALSVIPLQPADIFRVFAPGAVAIEAQVESKYVQVSGEVRQTGVVQLRKGETLRELVARLGGATEDGYVYATQLKRESVRRSQQAKLIEVVDRFERDLDSNAAQRLATTADKDNSALISAELARKHEQAQRMRQVKAEGRIVLELADGNAQVKNLPDLELQDGDSVYIPRRPGTVDILGAVFQQNSFVYKPRREVNDYVALAGGPTENADAAQTYLIHADGTAKGGRGRGWFSGGVGGSVLSPGDTVVVPERLDKNSWTQAVKEWTTILYQFGLGAAGLKVLKN